MKKIEAIIRPEALRPLQKALVAAGVPGMSASEVRGLGRQGSQVHLHTGNGLRLDFLRKVRVEIVLDDYQEAEVLRLIEQVNVDENLTQKKHGTGLAIQKKSVLSPPAQT